MDINKVFVVESAKGCDMLCVDGFLFHFDMCLKEGFIWACVRRKDVPCKCRVTTILDNGDLNKHIVKKVYMDHAHDRMDSYVIEEALNRKILSRAEGKPSSLEGKVLKRKIKLEQEHSKRRKILAFEQTDKLYLLKTKSGKQMVAYNGDLYNLYGKYVNSPFYRWQCIRSKDAGCKGFVETKAINEMDHVLRTKTDRMNHNHNGFGPPKLRKLCQNHNLVIVNDTSKDITNETEYFEMIVFDENSKERDVDAGSYKNALEISTLPDMAVNKYPCSSGSSHISNDIRFYCVTTKEKVSKKALSVNNYLYNFDKELPEIGQTSWICAMHNHSKFKCFVRITTTDSSSGIVVVSMSGQHNHASVNMENQAIVKNEPKQVQSTLTNFGKKTYQNAKNLLNKDMKCAAQKSRETFQRGLKRLNEKVKNKGYSKLPRTVSESSLSSLSDDLDSDLEDLENIKLPKSISSMKIKVEPDDNLKQKPKEIQVSPSVQKLLREMQQELDQEDADSKDLKLNDIEDVGEDIDNVELIVEYLEHHEDADEVEALDVPYEEEEKANTINADDNDSKDSLDTSFSSLDEFFAPIKNKTKTPEKAKSSKDKSSNTRKVSMVDGHLLVDGFFYTAETHLGSTTNWICIRNIDPVVQCKAGCTTFSEKNELHILRFSNSHSHNAIQDDMKNELVHNKDARESTVQTQKDERNKEVTLEEVEKQYNSIRSKKFSPRIAQKNDRTTMKLYAVSDGPPSLAVRMTLKALNIPFSLVNVDYCASEHMTEDYAKMNPQKEIPVLDDDGFFLPESIAIMQYLCDKYNPDSPLYPKDAKARALVNHRLCFNMGFYYASISAHSMAPIFFDYPRNEMSLKKVKNALQVFETYLERSGTQYAASNNVTLADFALVSSTICLEAIGFDLSPWPLVSKWYETFKKENPQLWEIANGGMQEIAAFEKNPPDLSHMNHPFHPTRKNKA